METIKKTELFSQLEYKSRSKWHQFGCLKLKKKQQAWYYQGLKMYSTDMRAAFLKNLEAVEIIAQQPLRKRVCLRITPLGGHKASAYLIQYIQRMLRLNSAQFLSLSPRLFFKH